MKKLCLVLLLALVTVKGFSTHIVGGEIYYDHLGGNNYRITLKVYRDCINGLAPFDLPASIGVFNASGVLLQNLMVSYTGPNPVPYSINNPCLVPPSNICVEEAIYDTVVNLPPIPGGYDITYQRCCRNSTILNLVSPGSVGSTYMCHIPDPAVVAVNSSPRFNNYPPVFICANQPVNFDHSATDPDGDLLVYEFADPFDGASSTYPMPQPPDPGPYNPIPWLAPYNTSYQMSSAPAMAVNSTTGLLTGTPNQIGQWVVGIRVKEYRNGQLISSNIRDFQFNVVNCPPVPVSSIPSQTTFCAGLTVNFQNASQNGTTYYWDFGDPNTLLDHSSLMTPSWTYAQPGTYNVMLIVNPGTPCADTGYTTFQVYPLLNPSFAAGPPQCLQGNSFNFTAAGAFGGGPGVPSFSWNFGGNASPATASTQNVNGVAFSAPGVYPVTFIVSENGCTKSWIDSVEVLPEPVLSYNPAPLEGCAPYTASFSGSSFADPSVVSVLWNFGDGSTSTDMNPAHVYITPGTYNVSVSIVTNNICLGNVTFTIPAMVTVYPSPVAGLSASTTVVTVFDPTVVFTDLSSGGTSCWISFGDGDSSNDCNASHTYAASGSYLVTQTVTNQYGCKDVFEILIEADMEAIFWIPNAFTPNHNGVNEFFGPVATGIQNYHFIIFDRWGNLIFETRELNKGWDGTLRGRPCQEDVYVWKATFENAGEHNAAHSLTGHVSLVH